MVGEGKAACIADLWSRCKMKTSGLQPNLRNSALIDSATLVTMTDDLLTATNVAFDTLYQRLLQDHAKANGKTARLTEKTRPAPAVKDEPEWFYLPGYQANKLSLYIAKLRKAGYPMANAADLRRQLVTCQKGTDLV